MGRRFVFNCPKRYSWLDKHRKFELLRYVLVCSMDIEEKRIFMLKGPILESLMDKLRKHYLLCSELDWLLDTFKRIFMLKGPILESLMDKLRKHYLLCSELDWLLDTFKRIFMLKGPILESLMDKPRKLYLLCSELDWLLDILKRSLESLMDRPRKFWLNYLNWGWLLDTFKHILMLKGPNLDWVIYKLRRMSFKYSIWAWWLGKRHKPEDSAIRPIWVCPQDSLKQYIVNYPTLVSLLDKLRKLYLHCLVSGMLLDTL